MIVEMKKISVLCASDGRDESLERLRELGVLHIVPVRQPGSADLEKVREQIQSASTALEALDAAGSNPENAKTAGKIEADEAVEAVHKIAREREQLREAVASLEKEKQAFEPFGAFDPADIHDLEQSGLIVKLYYVAGKACPPSPEGADLVELSRDSGGAYVALVSESEVEYEGVALALPKRSFATVDRELNQAREKLNAETRKLAGLTSLREPIKSLLNGLQTRAEFMEAAEGMGDAGEVVYLQGFCPVDKVERLHSASEENGWGLLVQDPATEDNVPTLIKYPWWVKPAKSLFGFLGIKPGYRETDVSPAFLIFLSIFFAMIVGDAGYGIILLSLTLLLRARFKDAAPEPFRLMTIFMSSTVVWGVLTANYFGIPPQSLPAILQAPRIEWLANQDNSMTFCFVLGAIHLSLAHAWNIVRYINKPKALSQAGWICVTWTMFAAARHLLLKAPFPMWAKALPIIGFALVLLGIALERDWMQLPTLPQDIIASFGDLMSYLRLFALGIAGVKVAEAFNDMAGMIGYGNVFTIIGAAMVLLLGHVLNIILCAMSVLVHGVRLNALEFSLHMGQEWSGFDYSPFGRENSEEL